MGLGEERLTAARRAAVVIVLAVAVELGFAGRSFAAEPAPRRLRACVVSLNSPLELEVFRSKLDPNRFEFVDLLAAAKAHGLDNAPIGSGGAPWLVDACTPQTTCDIVIYSAEFAGRFFGKAGPSLGLQEMEEASCQDRCAGLFHKPLEVFLLACNTLASKDEDNRSPQEYLQVLLDHGFDRAAAERVVELRYGPLGPSFRESLRRIFAGVPRIYGFSSVAPRSEYTAPMLAHYLQTKGDYATALTRTGRNASRNAALFASFRGTSLAQTTGLTAMEAGAVDRRHICALYDESRPVVERLRIAYGFLVRPDALTFVPTVETFLSRHLPESFSPDERAVFFAIQSLDEARDAVLQLVRRLNVSALKLELAHFAVLVGWLQPAEFHALAVDGARQLLHQPVTSEAVDIMCEITKRESLHADFRLGDISPMIFADAEGLRLLACLAPSDPRVSPALVPGLRNADPAVRQWSAYTLTQLVPRDEAVLVQLVPYLRDPSPDIAGRIRWLFQAQGPLSKGVLRAIRQFDSTLLQERADRLAPDASASGNTLAMQR